LKIQKAKIISKFKNYLKKFQQSKLYEKGKWIIDKAKEYHENIKQIDVDNLDPESLTGRNPYQLFFHWLLDVFASGVQIALVAVILVNRRYGFIGFFVKAFGFGLVLELIKMIRKAIKGED
jgi:hypothetical protein